MNRQPSSTSSRSQLVWIVGIALASLGGAWLLFYLTAQGGLWGTTNKGDFVDPPLTVADVGLRTRSGEPFDPAPSWWLWVVPQGPCDDDCQTALHQLRQLHVLLSRDASRVRRALVVPAGLEAPDLSERYPRLEVLSGNLTVLERGIYVVDPLGNLVFRYELNEAGEPVLDDLKRLLKVSQIG